MITGIATAILYVDDQDEALHFYRDVLGFDVVQDGDMGEEGRWLEVKPAGAQTSIMLASAERFGKRPGDGGNLTFAADDVAATVEELHIRCDARALGDLRHRGRAGRPPTPVQRAPPELSAVDAHQSALGELRTRPRPTCGHDHLKARYSFRMAFRTRSVSHNLRVSYPMRYVTRRS